MQNHRLRRLLRVALLSALLGPAGAEAGPLGGIGGLPGGILQGAGGTLQGTVDPLARTATSGVNGVVRDVVGRPRGTRALEEDEAGAHVVRGEILAVSPTSQSLATARNLSFAIVRLETLPVLGVGIAVLGVPDGMSASDALAALRKADNQGTYDYDHIYNPSGETTASLLANAAPSVAQSAHATKIGMIDAGIDRKHEAFAAAQIIVRNVVGDKVAPATAHGTAVASLLIGNDGAFHGALPGATLYAADVFGGEQAGGAADDIARALGWLAESGVPVVNVSLAGPPNALLEAAVKAFVKRGGVIVAAVGNNGPAAAPCYPAAYAGVVGVTAIDTDHEIMVDANRGNYVSLAALGVDIRAARPGRGYDELTGTSYAAPTVTARFALLLSRMDPTLATRARTALEQAATHPGAPGRDVNFGYGYLDPPSLSTSSAAMR